MPGLAGITKSAVIPEAVSNSVVPTIQRISAPEFGTLFGKVISGWSPVCVPILLAGERGRAVAAVHAGWRGLAGGVIGAGLAALRDRIGESEKIVAAIGPHIGPCCYEVDEPVLAAMAERFSRALPEASRPTRPGHVRLDLARLARDALSAEGVDPARIGSQTVACTACDSERFHSYRRDGPKAGRLFHFIAAGRG